MAVPTRITFERGSFLPMGDGDAQAIGGNHFIHACRRSMDMAASS